MRSTLESTLPWWVAGPLLGLVIVSLLGLGAAFGASNALRTRVLSRRQA